MAVIYKATNKINGHSYIGFDVKWPYRKANHKSRIKKGSTLVFHNALRSYGFENFEWEILEESEDKEKLLNEREEFYIRKYNTFYQNGQGYNMTMGGEATLGWIPSEETKRKIGKANSRCTLTPEGREAKRIYSKNNNPMANPIHREKVRQKALESKTTAKKVTNGFKIFDSIREAQKETNVNYNTLYHWISHNKKGWSFYFPSVT